MKNIQKLAILISSMGMILGATISIYAVDGEAVSIKAHKKVKNIEIEFNIKKGYGIQKAGPHELVIYSLKNNFSGKGNIGKAFETEGKQVYQAKPLKFSGKTSTEDDEYFSSVDQINAPVSINGKTGIRAKVFFCSFKDYFCSVDTLNAIIE